MTMAKISPNIRSLRLTSVAYAAVFCGSVALFPSLRSPASFALAFSPSSDAKLSLSTLTSAKESKTAVFSESNPLKSIFGAVSSSISNIQQSGMMSSLSSTEMSRLDVLTTETLARHDIAGSWDTIRSVLANKQTTDDERFFRQNLEKGYGMASPLHSLRLFDESNKEEDVRVTLFRDSASWCPYCQKVWMTLEQKRIPYRIEKVNMRCYGDKTPAFLAMQPNGNIPVAIIDGVTYRQSNDIIYALEELFPENERLMDFDDRMKAQELLRLEREIFSAWMYWLTSGDSPDGRLRDNFISVLNKVESALNRSSGDFFMGTRVTTVDIMFAPFLERTVASLLFFKGFQIRVAPGQKTEYPAIDRWFNAMETLESYQLTKSDYYTHCWDLPPQLGGCVPERGSEPFQDAINGIGPGSWELPLTPHNGGLEPDWAWCNDDGIAKREAVERVSANAGAIIKFASRGAGKAGFPRYGAPLADPKAVSNGLVQPSVDAALRIVCQKLLSDEDNEGSRCSEAMKDVVAAWRKEGGDELVEKIQLSLIYLRDRIGVPRDMRLPAARHLRAHLNWAIGYLLND
eukprot:CAMPEP_0171328628 /NCGR_PEP_ID=MMETSP0878-20121228/761_1 /TAXON_ID=67004 /ORGANISM="Thalassiosira weissflogii, Strain CCMP1336" /LENGTH=572 /DNA_ID=CAMNT_0011828489 /DNA_START=51 /DNA_END=1769 /DNA_ORIENTATION=+